MWVSKGHITSEKQNVRRNRDEQEAGALKAQVEEKHICKNNTITRNTRK